MRSHERQCVAGQIRAAAARNDRTDRVGCLCRRHERGAGARCSPRSIRGAGPRSRAGRRAMRPQLRSLAARSADVEDLRAVARLFVFEKIDQQRCQACFLQHLRDILVARAFPPAAAAVCEEDDRGRLTAAARAIPRKRSAPGIDGDFVPRATVGRCRIAAGGLAASGLRASSAGEQAGNTSSSVGLGKVFVPQTDGAEVLGGDGADAAIGDSFELGARRACSHRHGDHDFGGLSFRRAASAARIVEPVARPSSIKITVFPVDGSERPPPSIDRLAALELTAFGFDLGLQLLARDLERVDRPHH